MFTAIYTQQTTSETKLHVVMLVREAININPQGENYNNTPMRVRIKNVDRHKLYAPKARSRTAGRASNQPVFIALQTPLQLVLIFVVNLPASIAIRAGNKPHIPTDTRVVELERP
ncbi:Uncharacterized protein CEY00_Acc11156 [Actinidia chinensis var. chinensis]|uniref:Uncharacterized protein n=1 Tax=Actinidia chinensis var. chinensis TaxID=1590841 RepID=A0A2R6R1L8_ACTCC|nr:Uncharacterized protein CEY00_Acc11156 [Actinidia chinensis var. chinensis]